MIIKITSNGITVTDFTESYYKLDGYQLSTPAVTTYAPSLIGSADGTTLSWRKTNATGVMTTMIEKIGIGHNFLQTVVVFIVAKECSQ